LIKDAYSDGDSFMVEHEGESYCFRLYFVDTPEDNLFYPERVGKQADYFSISKDDVLEVGEDASKFTRKFLRRPFTVYTAWHDAMGKQKRYAALVYSGDRSLVEALVQEGLVRIHGFRPDSAWPGGVPAVLYLKQLKSMEQRAKEARMGAWHYVSASKDGAEGHQRAVEIPVKAQGEGPEIDLNTASEEALRQVPGVGAVLAARIIEARPYVSVDELVHVRGIGQKSLEKLSPFFTINEAASNRSAVPRYTADYYAQDALLWNRSFIRLSIGEAHFADGVCPDGFFLVEIATVYAGKEGGKMPLYVPREIEERFWQIFSEKQDEPVFLEVFYFRYQGKYVAVLRQK